MTRIESNPWARLAGFVGMGALLMWGGWLLMGKGVYGLALFVAIPIVLGALAECFRKSTTWGRAAGTGALTLLILNLSLLALGKEGMICIAMSIPLTVPLGALGGSLAYAVRRSFARSNGTAVVLLLVPLSAGTLGFDLTAKPVVFQVRSTIEIAAPPEQVWKYVVAFPELPEPQEWYFRAGLAYPTQTRIEGSGEGSARYCDLSTGSVVESVEIWDEPRVLRFRVKESPAPMREWSPYGEIVPKHLHGYFLSKEGQFQLMRLPNNHTLVEGISWYQHGLWPAQYWRWWSDAIVHRIHMRVLTHIKVLAERDGS